MIFFSITFYIGLCLRLEKMSTRFDRTNFVAGIETLFNFVTYILRNNSEDEGFGNEVISEVNILYQL